MISCELGGKKYTMDFVTGRALREIDDAANMYLRLARITEDASAGKVNSFSTDSAIGLYPGSSSTKSWGS